MIDITFFVGEDWINCEKIAVAKANAVPAVGEIVEIRNKMDLQASDAVHAVRHVFDAGSHIVEILFFERGPSVYEKRGVLMV